MASNFLVFVPYRVEVSVARLKRKISSWRRISSVLKASLCRPGIFYALVVLGCAPLHKVHRELPLCGLPVLSCSAGKHLNAELGIVCRILLGLSQVSSVPQGLHCLLPHGHCPLAPKDCGVVSVCSDVANKGGLGITVEFPADSLHSLVLSAYGILVG